MSEVERKAVIPAYGRERLEFATLRHGVAQALGASVATGIANSVQEVAAQMLATCPKKIITVVHLGHLNSYRYIGRVIACDSQAKILRSGASYFGCLCRAAAELALWL